MGATLLQKQEGKIRVIPYAFKTLHSPKQNFTPCEKKCLALIWTMEHWEYIIGSSQNIVQTTHSLLKYIVSRKFQDGTVSSPRWAQWTLALMNRGNTVQKEKRFPPFLHFIVQKIWFCAASLHFSSSKRASCRDASDSSRHIQPRADIAGCCTADGNDTSFLLTKIMSLATSQRQVGFLNGYCCLPPSGQKA